MFINDVNKIDEIRNIVVQDLKLLGIKYRHKKPRHHVQETRSRKVFKMPLHSLGMETVTLPSGQQLVVPKIVHELCSYIILKIDTEGLFRKGGSRTRQNEIRLSLDNGCYLGEEHHEIDVASVLKTFFRELPEPLIPYLQHELFLRCMMLERNQKEAVLLSSLLLPTEHLNTLAYFMQFLFRVAEYQRFNKMDSYNLAVVIGPTLLPAEEKISHYATHRLTKTCELFKLLIENAGGIGVLSEGIIERIAVTCSSSSLNGDEECAKKKKKRRSGSLTRMLSGLKKIVSNKSEDSLLTATPDLLSTPSVTRSTKKRKMEGGLSHKKRKEIMSQLPQHALLNSPYTPARTPVSAHPNAKTSKSPSVGQRQTSKNDSGKEKKLLWTNRPKANKKEAVDSASLKSVGGSSIQRRWSAVSSAAGFRKKKKHRTSCAGSLVVEGGGVSEKDPQIDNKINGLSEKLTKQEKSDEAEPNYLRISKTEYEDIKNRVIAIERRISVELDNAILDCHEVDALDGVNNVEKAYEETLAQAEPPSPTTDQLAKRLSRELKIRKSSERKVFRSPSARKIGSIRRKSKDGSQVLLTRNQTWCVTDVTPRSALKVRKTNTIQLASLHQAPQNDFITNDNSMLPEKTTSFASSSPSMTTRSISASHISTSSCSSWRSANHFFGTPDEMTPNLEHCRASLAKLRSQNAGMVLAKARLFDNLVDCDHSGDGRADNGNKPCPKANKIGALRNMDNCQSYRLRALRLGERRTAKKSMTPRKRVVKSPNSARGQKTQLVRYLNIEGGNCTSGDVKMTTQPTTPCAVPHIKKSLNTKSPRRLCRTPITTDSKPTPLKVMPMRRAALLIK